MGEDVEVAVAVDIEECCVGRIVQLHRLLAGRLAEQQFLQDPSDLSAYASATSQYNKVNAPALALALREQLDPRFLPKPENQDLDWMYASLAFSLYQLGRYEAVDSLAKAYPFPLIPDALAVLHLKALTRLARWERWQQQLRQYLHIGVVNTSGNMTPPGQILPLVCDELLLTGQQDHLLALAKELENWAVNHPDAPDHYRALGFAYYYQQDYARAYAAWRQESADLPSLPGWLRLNLEVSKISRLAICQAKLGHPEAARAFLQQIVAMESDKARWPETQQYHLAQVWTALGEEEKALQALERAVEGGYAFYQPGVYNSDPFLLPLQSNPRFQALVQPRRAES